MEPQRMTSLERGLTIERTRRWLLGQVTALAGLGSAVLAFADKIQSHGVKILYTLWTVGRYDIVHIFEADDDKAAATFSYTLSALGNVRTNTMRAFDIGEMHDVVSHVQTPYDLLREGVPDDD